MHERARLLDEINRVRSAAGVHVLTSDARLDLAAQRHADELAQREMLDHVGAGNTSSFDRIRAAGYAWRAAAENIASGNADPYQTSQQWVHSSGHYQNMINVLYRHAGIGHAVSRSGSHYWTLDLATPW